MDNKTKDKNPKLSDNELSEVSGGAIKGSGQSPGTGARPLYRTMLIPKYGMILKYAVPIKPQPLYGIPAKPGETQTEEKESDNESPMPISPPDSTK